MGVPHVVMSCLYLSFPDLAPHLSRSRVLRWVGVVMLEVFNVFGQNNRSEIRYSLGRFWDRYTYSPMLHLVGFLENKRIFLFLF